MEYESLFFEWRDMVIPVIPGSDLAQGQCGRRPKFSAIFGHSENLDYLHSDVYYRQLET